ncbi:MAG TPA: hypothetical protein VKZ53_04420 [Candidatus Angelobacter sp.]|nr:hypothetical protein [Candidatus Angelobacter sp.]
MDIGRKLYRGFGSILVISVVVFLVILASILKENEAQISVERATELAGAIDDIDHKIMENRLSLSTFLLTGNRVESERVVQGGKEIDRLMAAAESKADALEEEKNTAYDRLESVRTIEANWLNEVAAPLIEKRTQIESGKTGLPALEAAFVRANEGKWRIEEADRLKKLAEFSSLVRGRAQEKSEGLRVITMGVTVAGFLLVVILIAVVTGMTAKEVSLSLVGLATALKKEGGQSRAQQMGSM